MRRRENSRPPSARAPLRGATRDAAKAPGNQTRLRLTDRSLAGALPVALRLVRIHLAHLLQQIARVRLGNVWGFGSAAVTLLRSPRHGRDRFFRPFWHEKTLPLMRQNANWRELASVRRRCQTCRMIRFRSTLALLFLSGFLAINSHAQ